MQGFQADKLFHCFSHAIIIILYFYPQIAFQKLQPSNKTCFKFFLALIVFGISIELLQKYFVPNRHFDWLDIAANICGDIIGMLIIKYLVFRLAGK